MKSIESTFTLRKGTDFEKNEKTKATFEADLWVEHAQYYVDKTTFCLFSKERLKVNADFYSWTMKNEGGSSCRSQLYDTACSKIIFI